MQARVFGEQQLTSYRSILTRPATTARALSPLPDQLSLTDTPASEGILTTSTHTQRSPTGRREIRPGMSKYESYVGVCIIECCSWSCSKIFCIETYDS